MAGPFRKNPVTRRREEKYPTGTAGPTGPSGPTGPTGPAGAPGMAPERGLSFSRTDVDEITITASMPYSNDALVHTWNGSAWQARTFTGTRTINFSTNGAGALLSGSVSANTGYYLSPISTASGTISWIAHTSQTVSLASLPSGYVEVGRWRWWVPTDGSSELRDFKQTGPVFTYKSDFGVFALGSYRGVGGLATSLTTVDATGLVPEGARLVWCPWTGMNNSSAKTLTIYSGSGLAIFDKISSSAAASSAYSWDGMPWDYEGDPAAFFKYQYTGTPGSAGGEQGLNVPIRDILLHETMGAVI